MSEFTQIIGNDETIDLEMRPWNAYSSDLSVDASKPLGEFDTNYTKHPIATSAPRGKGATETATVRCQTRHYRSIEIGAIFRPNRNLH